MTFNTAGNYTSLHANPALPAIRGRSTNRPTRGTMSTEEKTRTKTPPPVAPIIHRVRELLIKAKKEEPWYRLMSASPLYATTPSGDVKAPPTRTRCLYSCSFSLDFTYPSLPHTFNSGLQLHIYSHADTANGMAPDAIGSGWMSSNC